MTMQSLLIIILPALLLSGCQSIPNLQKPIGTLLPNCLLPEAAVKQFLEDEHLYMTANSEQRMQMLKGTKSSPERLANLLSSPGNEKASLEKSLLLFNELPLLPNESCLADRYLYLRLRQTQAHLSIIEELHSVKARLNTAKVTIEIQQQQIDALTQIEQSITRQREEP